MKCFKLHFLDVIKALTKINFESKKADERNQALYVKKKIENFNFVITLLLIKKILTITNLASSKLQKIDQDLSNATNLLKVCLTNVKDLRDKFSDILTEAKLTCQKWGIDIQTFSNKRARIVKKHYDELSIDYRFNNAEDMYKVNVFLGLWILLHSN